MFCWLLCSCFLFGSDSVFQHDSSAADGDDGAVGSEEDDKQQQQQQQQQQGQTHSTMQEAAAADDESEDMDNAAAAADAPFELTDLDCEVRLLHAAQQQQAVQVDAVALTRAFCKQCCWRVLAVNEVRWLKAKLTAAWLPCLTA
jgi:hypothetical protein